MASLSFRFLASVFIVLAGASFAWSGGTRTETPTLSPSPTPVGSPGKQTTPTVGVGAIKANTGVAVPPAVPNVPVNQAPQAPSQAPAEGAGAAPQETPPPAPDTVNPQEPSASAPPVEQSKTAPPPASGGLKNTAAELKKQNKEAAEGDLSKLETLEHVFDAAALRGAKTPGSGAPPAVRGRMLQVKDQVFDFVLDATDRKTPPASVPGLLLEAIGRARNAVVEKVLASDEAQEVTKTVKEIAAVKAKTSLMELANAAYQAAAKGSAFEAKDAVKIALKAFDKWETLLGSPGRPLIENARQLKNDIRRVQAEAVKAGLSKKIGAPVIRVALRGKSYFADLPPSSVVPLTKSLAKDMDLTNNAPALSAPARATLAWRLNPTRANGFRQIYRERRSRGYSRPRSFLSAGVYWLKATLGGLWHGLRRAFLRLVRGAMDPSEAGLILDGIDRDYLSAMRLLARSSPQRMRMSEVESLLTYASRMAKDYDRLSGDDAGLRAVANLSRLIREERSRLGLTDAAVVSPGILALARPSEADTLGHWIERIHDEAGRAAGSSEAPRSAPIQALNGFERLREDVKARPQRAREMAELIQSADPDPSHFVTIGSARVDGRELWAEDSRRRIKDGAELDLYVLRDSETGLASYGRAELCDKAGEKCRAAGAKDLKSLLAR